MRFVTESKAPDVSFHDLEVGDAFRYEGGVEFVIAVYERGSRIFNWEPGHICASLDRTGNITRWYEEPNYRSLTRVNLTIEANDVK